MALVDMLEEAVIKEPRIFLPLLLSFLEAKRPFQYGIINGFKRLRELSKEEQAQIDWNSAWEKLTEFFEWLILSPGFWVEEVQQIANIVVNPSTATGSHQ